ncbi:MAG: hypothetical protein ABSC21_14450 [Terriglobia bacterium]
MPVLSDEAVATPVSWIGGGDPFILTQMARLVQINADSSHDKAPGCLAGHEVGAVREPPLLARSAADTAARSGRASPALRDQNLSPEQKPQPSPRSPDHVDDQRVFRIAESSDLRTKVHVDKEDPVRETQTMNVRHALRVAPLPNAFKEPR